MLAPFQMLSSRDLSSVKKITPERELLIAILDRAVLDFCGREGELHEKAKEWIFVDEIEHSFNANELDSFSFSSICEYLGLNKQALRERILSLDIPKNVSQAHRWLRTKVQSDKYESELISAN